MFSEWLQPSSLLKEKLLLFTLWTNTILFYSKTHKLLVPFSCLNMEVWRLPFSHDIARRYAEQKRKLRSTKDQSNKKATLYYYEAALNVFTTE